MFWSLPQSLVFSASEILLSLRKTPFGTSPSRSVEERFKCCKKGSFCMRFGIGPVKLFHERSRSRIPFCEARVEGGVPRNELPCR